MKKGLTLVELLIVISIIAIVSAIVLPSYRSGNRKLILERATHELHHNIRRAQEMAMSAKKIGASVPAGFGIYLDTTDPNKYRYVTYADTSVPVSIYDPGDTMVTETPLEGGVFIDSIVMDGTSYTSGAVNFMSPDPTTRIHRPGWDESFGLMEITLKIDPPGLTSTIEVNEAGSIYPEN